MSRIRDPWTPSGADLVNNERGLGFEFQSDVPITVSGLWWYQVDDVTAPAQVTAELYLTSTQERLVTSGAVSTTGFTADDWNLIEFDAFSASADTSYTANVYITGGIRFDSDDLAEDIVDASGHVRMLADKGRFINGSGPAFPSDTWSGLFGVDVEFELSSAETVTGTAAASFGFSATASGTRTVGGVAAAPFGFAAAAAGTRVVKGVAAASFGFAAPAVTVAAVGVAPAIVTSTPVGRYVQP